MTEFQHRQVVDLHVVNLRKDKLSLSNRQTRAMVEEMQAVAQRWGFQIVRATENHSFEMENPEVRVYGHAHPMFVGGSNDIQS